MTAPRSLRVAVSCGLGVLLWAFAREAAACSPPPYGWFAYGPGEVPANGVLPIRYRCESQCADAPDPQAIIVRSSSGDEIPGSVISTAAHDDRRYLIFKPEPDAFTVGEALTLELAGATFYSESVEVVPPVSWSATLSVAEEFGHADTVAGLEVCCTGPLDTCGEVPCFHTEFERTALLHIQWGDESSPEHAQYAFRILRPDGDPEPSWDVGSRASYELAHSEQTTCYTLELQRFVDGSIITFDERCVDRPAAIVPGLHPTLRSSIRSTLESCNAPPDGYVTAWCEEHADDCLDPDSSYCATYGQHCDATGIAGMSGAAEGEAGPEVTRGGCGCAVPVSRTFDGTAIVGLLALGWFGARRQARSSPPRGFRDRAPTDSWAPVRAYPFTAPLVSPPMNSFSSAKNSTAGGMMASSVPAKKTP